MPDEQKSLWETVREAFVDLVADYTTLDVVTLSGSIDIKQQVDQDKIDLAEVYKALRGQTAEADTAIKVVAFTHLEPDADAVNFVSSDLTEDQKGLVVAHAENVKAAQETRAGMIRTIKALFQ